MQASAKRARSAVQHPPPSSNRVQSLAYVRWGFGFFDIAWCMHGAAQVWGPVPSPSRIYQVDTIRAVDAEAKKHSKTLTHGTKSLPSAHEQTCN